MTHPLTDGDITRPEEGVRLMESDVEGMEIELSAEEIAERERVEKARADRMARLDALGMSIAAKRTEAIHARIQSGIEDQWEEDQEFYEGIDDANRGEFAHRRNTKPMGYVDRPEKTTTSTIFPNITAPYCDAAAARISDMLLPTDDRSWGLGPTPIPELAGMAEGKFPPDVLRQVAAENPGQPDVAKERLHAAVDQAIALMDEAKDKATKAEKRIEDWHVECQWHAEVRKVIEDAGRLGAGVLKGPEPVRKRAIAFKSGALIISEKINPASRRINPWDLFPDGACGENIHNGAHIFERDRLSPKGLIALKGTPGYIDEQIDACLEEGPTSAVALAQDPNIQPDQRLRQFEIWYFYGSLTKDDAVAAGCECGEEMVNVPAIITMVNSRVIRASLNPLDTGDFPYDVIPWRRKAGMPWGDGVARQIRAAQRIVTAALRAMMTNAGRASGPMIVWKQGVVVPADGKATITPWKLLYVGEDFDGDDVRKAVAAIQIPMYQAELERIIQLGLKLAEDVTGLPMLMQGQQGRAPDTVGGMQILNDNASAVLRRMARTFDDYITEPHVRRYYAWLLQYGEDEEKGDFQIDARGSSALVERSLQAQEMTNLLAASGNPVFGIDPKKTMEEHLKSRKLDPKAFQFDDEKWQEIMSNMGKGPQDQSVAVAQIRTQADKEIAQFREEKRAENAAAERELKLVIAQIDAQLASAGLTADQQKVLAEIKGRLGDTVIKVRAQQSMQREANAVQMSKPPVEPAGRAQPGEAYVQ